MTIITQILKERRIELRISQQALADWCGFAHRSNISRLESGELEWKLRDVLRAIELLGLTIEIKPAK